MAFPGTFIVVSHDRYFLDKVANTTAELADGTLVEYEGSYSYYRMRKELAEKEAAEERTDGKGTAGDAPKKEAAKSAKGTSGEEGAAKARIASGAARADEEGAAAKKAQEQRRLASLSDAKRAEMLARAEAEMKGLEFEMNQPEVQGDPQKSAEIAERYAAKEEEIAERYERWEALAEQESSS